MPPIQPEQARSALAWVDPARMRSDLPVGLRDGALLALAAAGMNAQEICGLRCSEISMEQASLFVKLRRHGVNLWIEMPIDLGARLLAWLTERRLWADPGPVFTGPQGPLSPAAIYQILYRYQQQKRARG